MDISNAQLRFDDNPLVLIFNNALTYIREAKFDKALEMMENVLHNNADFPAVVEAIKSIKFWENRWLKIMRQPLGKEQADLLINEWNNYLNFIKSFKLTENFNKVFVTFKNLIYKKIIKNLILEFEKSDVPSLDLLKKLGSIFFEIEDYNKAIEILEYAKKFNSKDSFILSLLAESYYFTGNEKEALLLFKEAFFYEPSKIDLSLLKSDPIKKLKEVILNDGIPEKYLSEWIPVYGTVLNIFNIRREISKDEINKIISDADEIEMELNNPHLNKEIAIPRLINKYLWIIEYYFFQLSNKNYTRIYLNKLKNINFKIYEKYLNLINFSYS